MELIVGHQLLSVCPTLSRQRADFLSEKMNFISPEFGIKSKKVLQMFVAQCAHESGEFTHKVENMNYTNAARIKAIWPSRFKNEQVAQHYVRNPQALANLVYNGRMGNKPNSNDGWTFRGGGYIGLTGRAMYEKYRQYLRFDSLEETAKAVREDEYFSIHSAFWIFSEELRLNAAAERGDLLYCTKRINGGTTNYKDREEKYALAVKYIV